jgi:hypothetical protein
MRKYFLAAFLMLCQLAILGQAPKGPVTSPANEQTAGHSFAVVVGPKVLTIEGDWKQGERLRAYASSHPGTYIVFAVDGHLLLQQDSAAVSDAIHLYTALDRLGAEQGKLNAKQAPLTKQQAALGRQMKDATSPEVMRRVGAEQGRIGSEQSAIGRQQVRIGQEQGDAGRAFYNSVQVSINRCLREHTCSQT